MIGSSTRVFALLGHPVRHSLSPAMHNAAFRALGLDAVYVALDCAEPDVGPLIRALAGAGGGGNVTLPHKRIAAAALEIPGLEVCNTFWSTGGRALGANTDPDGILHALDALGVHAAAWLIVGTGGSALGCLEAARRRGVRVAIRSRDPARALTLTRDAEARGITPAPAEECELVVNATPLGLDPGDPAPVSLASLPRLRAVLDLVYAKGRTPLVRGAVAAGLDAADGREVLLGQGVAAFRLWFPELDPPVEVMRAALRAHLD